MRTFIIVLTFILSLSLKAQALNQSPAILTDPYALGGNSSAGGDGVIIGNNIYLADFVESNIHHNTYIRDLTNYSTDIANEIANYIGLEQEVAQIISAKLFEIYEKSSSFEFLLKYNLLTLNWNFVPHDLLHINDEDFITNLYSYKTVQLAGRKNYSIFINIDTWNKLNNVNKAGLILHEVIYHILDQFSPETNNSSSTRILTALIFSEKIDKYSKSRLRHILKREGIEYINTENNQYDNLVLIHKNFNFIEHDKYSLKVLNSLNIIDYDGTPYISIKALNVENISPGISHYKIWKTESCFYCSYQTTQSELLNDLVGFDLSQASTLEQVIDTVKNSLKDYQLDKYSKNQSFRMYKKTDLLFPFVTN